MFPLLILQSTSFILLLTLDPTESSFIPHPSPPPLISDCLPVISLPLPHLTSFVNHPSSITSNLSPLTPPCTSSHSFISHPSLLPIPPSLPINCFCLTSPTLSTITPHSLSLTIITLTLLF